MQQDQQQQHPEGQPLRQYLDGIRVYAAEFAPPAPYRYDAKLVASDLTLLLAPRISQRARTRLVRQLVRLVNIERNRKVGVSQERKTRSQEKKCPARSDMGPVGHKAQMVGVVQAVPSGPAPRPPETPSAVTRDSTFLWSKTR